MRYFVGLGSNIEPRKHLTLMLRALLAISPTVQVGRVLQTEPVGVVGEPFLNVPVAITTRHAPVELKALFDSIEASLGRDRSAPDRKTRSRTADLDILFWLDEDATSAPAQLLPAEPYMRPMVIELLDAVGVQADVESPELAPGVPLSLDGLIFGEHPVTLRAAGDRVRRGALGSLSGGGR